MKNIILSFFAFTVIFPSFAQPIASGTFSASRAYNVVMRANRSQVVTEIPPWTIAGGWHTYLCHNGSQTVTYSDPNVIAPNADFDMGGHGPYFAIGPVSTDAWRRNYCGIYSAHLLTHPTAGAIDIGFLHCENKNICNGAENTIDPHIPINCSNSYQGYFGLVSAAWTPSVQSNNWGQTGYNNHLGPVLWPGSAYMASNDSAATQGLLQPSSIVYNNYIYVFIWDKGPTPYGPQNNPGITRGIKLVRVPVSGCLDPTQYQVYYKNPSGSVNWLPSLPGGLTPANMLNYVSVPGPLSTDILTDEIPANTECFRFTAAQVNGTNYFVGLEEYVDNNDMNTDASSTPQARHHVALRFSYDLINWSARQAVIETSANWGASYFNYPIFQSTDGWTNTAVNLNSFYVLGTHSPPLYPFFLMTITYSGPMPQAVNPAVRNGESTILASAGPDNLYPNPTQGNVKLNFTLNADAKVQVSITDIAGRPLQKEPAVWRSAGSYTENLDIGGLAKGVYFIELIANSEKKVYKVVLR